MERQGQSETLEPNLQSDCTVRWRCFFLELTGAKSINDAQPDVTQLGYD